MAKQSTGLENNKKKEGSVSERHCMLYASVRTRGNLVMEILYGRFLFGISQKRWQ